MDDHMLDILDEEINLMMAKVELAGEYCHLKHSEYDPAENHPAVNYLCQNLGDKETGEVKQTLRIPICEECSESLYDENWILVYCTYCNKSQWILRRLAKFEYPEGNLIYFLDICPFCAKVKDDLKHDGVK